MNALRGMAVVLVVVGLVAWAYDSFSYSRKTSEAELGPFSVAVERKETVNIPLWAGLAAIAVGAGLFLVSRRN